MQRSCEACAYRARGNAGFGVSDLRLPTVSNDPVSKETTTPCRKSLKPGPRIALGSGDEFGRLLWALLSPLRMRCQRVGFLGRFECMLLVWRMAPGFG